MISLYLTYLVITNVFLMQGSKCALDPDTPHGPSTALASCALDSLILIDRTESSLGSTPEKYLVLSSAPLFIIIQTSPKWTNPSLDVLKSTRCRTFWRRLCVFWISSSPLSRLSRKSFSVSCWKISKYGIFLLYKLHNVMIKIKFTS